MSQSGLAQDGSLEVVTLPISYISGGIISNDGTTPDEIINISAVKCRSSNDTQDIEVEAGSLNINTAGDWASGSVPSLTDATICAWAVYDANTPYYILDDSTGSNISVAKRRVSSFITDSADDIVPFTAYEMTGGGVDYTFDTFIGDSSTVFTTSVGTVAISAPNGLVAKISAFGVRDNAGFNGVIRNKSSLAVTSSTGFDFKAFGGGTVENGAISIKKNIKLIDGNVYVIASATLGISNISTNGYIDERVI